MQIEEVIETLKYYQKWRLGIIDEPQTNSKELTKALDEAIGYIEEHEYEARRSEGKE